MAPQSREYRAFISYSHQDDRRVRLDGRINGVQWADWLYAGLMDFRTPEGLAGQPGRYGYSIPERTWPVFRDSNELPTAADLSLAITRALDASEILVVLCSPRAAQSFYVNEEIRHFKAQGGANRVLGVILDGEPNASRKGQPALECFPEALRHPVKPDGTIDFTRLEEPIAADLRDPDDKSELDDAAFRAQGERLGIELKRIAAGIIGVGFGKLVDWEAVAREKNAHQMMAASDAEALRVESLSPARDHANILESLIKREALLESAAALCPKDEKIAGTLRSARRGIFELALSTSDLGLASFYLQRIEGDSASPSADEDWANLNAAWDRSDPSRSSELRRAFLLSVALPGVAIAGAMVYWWLLDESPNLKAFFMAGAYLLIAISTLLTVFIASLRFGKERFLPWATVAGYFVSVASIFAGNPVALVIGGLMLKSMSGVRIQRLIWKKE